MSPKAFEQMTGGIWGFVAGGVAAMLIGFQWGGWSTSGTTQKMSDEAVLASRAAICVSQFRSAPGYKANIKEFQAAESYRKSELVEKGGWDRMPGQDTASWGVAAACVAGLEATARTGA